MQCSIGLCGLQDMYINQGEEEGLWEVFAVSVCFVGTGFGDGMPVCCMGLCGLQDVH